MSFPVVFTLVSQLADCHAFAMADLTTALLHYYPYLSSIYPFGGWRAVWAPRARVVNAPVGAFCLVLRVQLGNLHLLHCAVTGLASRSASPKGDPLVGALLRSATSCSRVQLGNLHLLHCAPMFQHLSAPFLQETAMPRQLSV